MSAPERKPIVEAVASCPFCGKPPVEIAKGNIAHWWVVCGCSAEGPFKNTRKAALVAWNTRRTT